MILTSELIKIPPNELAYVMPDARKRLFMDMLNEYKVRFPNMKLIYATLNYVSDLKVDYLIVFKFPFDGEWIIHYDCPYIYTTRAIPGYRYCKREEKLDQWFKEAMEFGCRLPETRFHDFLAAQDLSLSKNDENHWKDPKYLPVLVKELADMMLQYKSKGSAKR